jgi:hypothetical protein
MNFSLSMENRRHLTDAQFNAHAQALGVKMRLGPLDLVAVRPIIAPATPLTRYADLRHANAYRLLEYRYRPDPLFLLMPFGMHKEQALRVFKDHYLAPIACDANGDISHFALPIRIGSIPDLAGIPIERCFAHQEGSRLDCTAILQSSLDWIPVNGGKAGDGSDIPPWPVAWETTLLES